MDHQLTITNPHWKHFWRGSFVMLALASSLAWGDTLHLRNGQTVDGKIKTVSGELIYYQNEEGNLRQLNRLELVSRHDVIELRKETRLLGELTFVSPYFIEVISDQGLTRISRWKIKHITLGVSMPKKTSPLKMPAFQGDIPPIEVPEE